jgi:hypothetical protein
MGLRTDPAGPLTPSRVLRLVPAEVSKPTSGAASRPADSRDSAWAGLEIYAGESGGRSIAVNFQVPQNLVYRSCAVAQGRSHRRPRAPKFLSVHNFYLPADR